MIKKKIKGAYDKLRFYLSSTNSFIYNGIHRYFYFPPKDTISYIIDNYSKKHKGDFTVIQIGANDGLINDPINKFIKRDKWRGVLLEPQKYVYDNFLSKVYRKDKDIVTLNAAIGIKDGSTSLYKIGFSNERWAHGLSSFNREILEKSLRDGYARRKALKEGVEIPTEPERQIVSEEVRVISPANLRKEYNIDKLDLLQIDTEGFDFEVIKMFNIAEFKPRIISFESLHFSDREYNDCISHLESKGYSCRTVDANTIAMRQVDPDFISFFTMDNIV